MKIQVKEEVVIQLMTGVNNIVAKIRSSCDHLFIGGLTSVAGSFRVHVNITLPRKSILCRRSHPYSVSYATSEEDLCIELIYSAVDQCSKSVHDYGVNYSK